MRLVEVNGAGWCLQRVSNRRGPGHLIIRLLVARRRTNRSCRREARADNTAQRSHARQEQRRAGLRAGTGWERGCSGPCRARLCTSAPPGDPPRSCSRLLPVPRPRGATEGAPPAESRDATASPGPSLARSLAPAPLPRAAARAAGAGEGRAAGCRGRGGASRGRQRRLPRRAPPLGPGTELCTRFSGTSSIVFRKGEATAKGTCLAFSPRRQGWRRRSSALSAHENPQTSVGRAHNTVVLNGPAALRPRGAWQPRARSFPNPFPDRCDSAFLSPLKFLVLWLRHKHVSL